MYSIGECIYIYIYFDITICICIYKEESEDFRCHREKFVKFLYARAVRVSLRTVGLMGWKIIMMKSGAPNPLL